MQAHIISTATLNPLHLIPAFVAYLSEVTHERPDLVGRDAPDLSGALEEMDAETLSEVLSALWDLMEEHAPEGTYFGAHEGDGACIGFWPLEEEEGPAPSDDAALWLACAAELDAIEPFVMG